MRNNKETRILEELYFGNIDPNTQSFDSDSNFGKAMQVMTDTVNSVSILHFYGVLKMYVYGGMI